MDLVMHNCQYSSFPNQYNVKIVVNKDVITYPCSSYDTIL